MWNDEDKETRKSFMVNGKEIKPMEFVTTLQEEEEDMKAIKGAIKVGDRVTLKSRGRFDIANAPDWTGETSYVVTGVIEQGKDRVVGIYIDIEGTEMMLHSEQFTKVEEGEDVLETTEGVKVGDTIRIVKLDPSDVGKLHVGLHCRVMKVVTRDLITVEVFGLSDYYNDKYNVYTNQIEKVELPEDINPGDIVEVTRLITPFDEGSIEVGDRYQVVEMLPDGDHPNDCTVKASPESPAYIMSGSQIKQIKAYKDLTNGDKMAEAIKGKDLSYGELLDILDEVWDESYEEEEQKEAEEAKLEEHKEAILNQARELGELYGITEVHLPLWETETPTWHCAPGFKPGEHRVKPVAYVEVHTPEPLLAKASITLEKSEEEPDMVNSPSHYNRGDGSIETIDYMEFLFGTRDLVKYCTINSYKYQARASHKGKLVEDLAKCQWYIDKANELSQKIGTDEEHIPVAEL